MKTKYMIAAATGAMLLTAPAHASWWTWPKQPTASSGGSTSTSSGNTSTSSGNTSTSSGSSGSTSSSGGPAPVPEPGVAGLFGAGALGLWLARRRRKQQ